MKIIILLLGIIVLIFTKMSIKNLFIPKEQLREKGIKSIKEALTKVTENKFILITFIIALIFLFFYLFSAIFINTFIFAIISIFLMFDTSNGFVKNCNEIRNLDTYKVRNIFIRLLSILIDLSYVGFVFYQIYLKW